MCNGFVLLDEVCRNAIITFRQAKAVNRPELHGITDVVIVSTKGHLVNGERLDRHLLSMLGGGKRCRYVCSVAVKVYVGSVGDYDGDRVQVYWHPEIVRDFRSADKEYATQPDSVEACLEKEGETVKHFLGRMSDAKAEPIPIAELQKYLLGSLLYTSLVGTISTMWENSLYQQGYSHPESIRLAYL